MYLQVASNGRKLVIKMRSLTQGTGQADLPADSGEERTLNLGSCFLLSTAVLLAAVGRRSESRGCESTSRGRSNKVLSRKQRGRAPLGDLIRHQDSQFHDPRLPPAL